MKETAAIQRFHLQKDMTPLRHAANVFSVIIFAVMAISGVHACCDQSGNTKSYSHLRTKDSESAMQFYGRLVDQFGNPVKGAKIIYVIEKYGLFFPHRSKRSVKTGNDGLFKIKGGNAARLIIEDAKLDGYEYLRTHNDDIFEYREYYNDEIRHTPSESNPVVLHIRKRESECCIILEDRFSVKFHNDDEDKWLGYNAFTFLRNTSYILGRGYHNSIMDQHHYLLHDYQRTPSDDEYKTLKNSLHPSCNDNKIFWDIEFFAENAPAKKQWILTIKTNGANAGLQLSERQLYMAPENGYQKELVIPIEYIHSHPGPQMHLFIRTDSPSAYMRLDLHRGLFCDSECLILEFNFHINPYGERLLESVAPFRGKNDENTLNMLVLAAHEKKNTAGHEVLKPLVAEAENAWKQRKLAPKPDIANYLKKGIIMFADHSDDY